MDTATIKGYASSSAPWRKGARWWVVMAEGILLLVIGIYALVEADGARKAIFAAFGILLAGNGLGGALDAFRSEPSRRTSFNALRGGIGLSLGLLALFAGFSDHFPNDSSRLILAFGYLAVGLINLVALVRVRKEAKFPLGQLAFNLALLVLAIMFFTGDGQDTSRIELLGWVSIVLGLLLGAFGFYLRSRAAVPDDTVETGPTSDIPAAAADDVKDTTLAPASDVSAAQTTLDSTDDANL